MTHRRLQPLLAKLLGAAPLCPWKSALAPLDPRTLGVYPPKLEISVVKEEEGLALLQFNRKHQFWFPKATPIDTSLWSEYLVCFWSSPTNYHHYFSDQVHISQGDVAVDCGSCEGFFARAALEAGAGKVICVEPSPVMAACLKKTFAEEIEAGAVIVEQVAVGSHQGMANFDASGDNAFAGRMDGSSETMVKLTTLSALARLHGIPNFIKMDLEGAEYEALAGGMELLTSYAPKLAVTTYHFPWDYPAVHALLAAAGYKSLMPNGVSMRETNIPRPVLILAHR